jgi:hypothetical protein
MRESARIHHMDPLDSEFAAALSSFARPDTYPLSPTDCLEHIRRVKEAVRIPVVASLNGITAEEWARFARSIEEAGADALELNIYEVAADPRDSGLAIETRIRDLAIDIKKTIAIPVAVKLAPRVRLLLHDARGIGRVDGLEGLHLRRSGTRRHRRPRRTRGPIRARPLHSDAAKLDGVARRPSKSSRRARKGRARCGGEIASPEATPAPYRRCRPPGPTAGALAPWSTADPAFRDTPTERHEPSRSSSCFLCSS